MTTDPTPPVAVRIARAFRGERVTPQMDRARRRIAAVGRGIHLGLDLVPDVVLVRMTEYGDTGVALRPGTLVAEVFGGDPREVLAAVDHHKPVGIEAVVVWRAATWRHRLAARWRYLIAEITGALTRRRIAALANRKRNR